jgi:(1->4)-alpha-D-glucan 1-alpha-D-glucosylmutase
MGKALREAKLRTSWISPNASYERGVAAFVSALFDAGDGASFRADFLAFLEPLLTPGVLNAASQTLLKIAAPGVPDFFQGTEIAEFRLVDPDNRRPVDFEHRRLMLRELDARDPRGADLEALLADAADGRLKLWVTSRALRFRGAHTTLFESGEYVGLTADGPRARNVVAFVRRRDGEEALVVAARRFTELPGPPIAEPAWADTALPSAGGPRIYRDVLTQRDLRCSANGRVPVAEAFAHLPLALLERIE